MVKHELIKILEKEPELIFNVVQRRNEIKNLNPERRDFSNHRDMQLMYFLLDELKTKDIARKFGVTMQRVHSLERKLLNELRGNNV